MMMTQPTPRGTDMANLSERLRAMADRLSAPGSGNNLLPILAAEQHAKDLATILDRLTVEGLAGVIGSKAAIGRSHANMIARALLTYITTPSVEESQ